MWPFRKRAPVEVLREPVGGWRNSAEARALEKLTFDELVAVQPYLAAPAWWPGIKHWRAMRAAQEAQAAANASAARHSRDDRVDALKYALEGFRDRSDVYEWFLPEEGRRRVVPWASMSWRMDKMRYGGRAL